MSSGMTYGEAVHLAQAMRTGWNQWTLAQRVHAVLRLRATVSQRKLAKIAGCSEGTIRNMEMVGRMPESGRELLRRGYALRRVLRQWRALKKAAQTT